MKVQTILIQTAQKVLCSQGERPTPMAATELGLNKNITGHFRPGQNFVNTCLDETGNELHEIHCP